jgi:hypothetical protein
MPTDAEHFAAAARNQELLDQLIPQVGQFPEWVVTVAFYKAVQLVEGLLFTDHPDKHSYSHEIRGDILKRHRYQNINKHYRPLYEASLVARYLTLGGNIQWTPLSRPKSGDPSLLFRQAVLAPTPYTSAGVR